MHQKLKGKVKGNRKFMRELSTEDKKNMCKRWKVSGLSKSQFCRVHKLRMSTFCGWCARLGVSGENSNWVKVKLPEKGNEIVSSEEVPMLLRISPELLLEMNLSMPAAVKLIESL
jgi:hypothetical protein